MNSVPLVSVLITTFNHEKFINDCINSVVAQDYPNVEIIVGDDASLDSTQEVLKSIDSNNPGRIKLLLSEVNEGVTKNCNRLLRESKGKYICFIGGDDLIFPTKVSCQVEYLELNPNCNMCFHNMEAFDSETGDFLYYTHDDGNGKRKRDGVGTLGRVL